MQTLQYLSLRGPNPFVCRVSAVLCGFGVSCYKMKGLDSEPPYFAATLSFVGGSEGLGRGWTVKKHLFYLHHKKVKKTKMQFSFRKPHF